MNAPLLATRWGIGRRLRLEPRLPRLLIEILFWAALAAGFEIAGRRAPNDWVDLLAAALLVAVGAAASNPCLGLELPRVIGRAATRVARGARRLVELDFGADFHPERPPRLAPLRRTRLAVAVLALVDLGLAATVLAFGSPLHAALRVSYLLYLALYSLVVPIAAAGLVAALDTAARALLARLLPGAELPRGRLDRRRLLGLWLLAALVAAAFLPLDALVGASGWLVAFAAALLILLPSRLGPRVGFRLVVRTGGGAGRRGRQAGAIDVEELVRFGVAVPVLLGLGVALVVQGHRLPFAAGDGTLVAARFPVAHLAGRLAAWMLGAGGLLASAVYAFEFTVGRRRADPAWPGPVAADRGRVVALVKENLDRARTGRRERGEGFLFAPQWWPWPSDRMARDAFEIDGGGSEERERREAPQPGLDLPARRLLRGLLQALEIDLLYFEDGVPSDRLPAVFDGLFRHYDARGGGPAGIASGPRGRRLGEHDLVSPPGVQLLIEEIGFEPALAGDSEAPGEPRDPALERPDPRAPKRPDLESLSRARVLLVRRRRAGEDDVEPGSADPFAFAREPGWVDRFLSHLPAPPGVPVRESSVSRGSAQISTYRDAAGSCRLTAAVTAVSLGGLFPGPGPRCCLDPPLPAMRRDPSRDRNAIGTGPIRQRSFRRYPMRLRLIASVVAVVAAGLVLALATETVWTQETKKAAGKAAETGAPPEMAPAQPGPEHALLAKGAGKWKAVQKSMMDPSKPPVVSEGTEECTLICNGLFLRSDYHVQGPEGDFHGASIMGFDTDKRKYTGIWVDTYATQMWSYEGTCDQAGKCTFMMESVGPDGSPVTSKMIEEFVDPNTRKFVMQAPGPDGTMMTMLEITYTRM